MSWYIGSCGHPVPTTCRACDHPALGVDDSQLAVLFRQLQWMLDDAAYDFPAGRATPRRREELAGSLEALAAIVRASAPDGVIIDPKPRRPRLASSLSRKRSPDRASAPELPAPVGANNQGRSSGHADRPRRHHGPTLAQGQVTLPI